MTSTDGTSGKSCAQAGEAKARPQTARVLSPAAKRALAEAEARRQTAKAELPREIGGRGGEDPARYGDWEINGRATDF